MAILTGFIGIDEHASPDVRNLTGARRDATALWALFADTMALTSPALLCDEMATASGIRRLLDDTLGKAGPEDIVILSFSGHGSEDHYLVAHDTTIEDFESTTIAMDELAQRFRDTRAKAVLFILDCCFSGGAPAKVLSGRAIPRSPKNPYAEISGTGKVLIAASAIDEPAYEHPASRHGLLTKALLDVFQTDTPTISVISALDEVASLVRAEAARIGIKQTPVLFGHLEGSLTLPALQPGTNYYELFPEKRGARVTSNLQDLAVFGISPEIRTEWEQRFPDGLNTLQMDAVNEYRILDEASLLVVAPTSSGKTFIGELAACRAVLDGRKAVFLMPYKALVSEKYDQFSALYGDTAGMRVIRCTGDYADETNAFMMGKYDLALLTYEMFLGLMVNGPAVLNQIGLVVLDEAQFITDPNRGITVELILTYLLSARQKGIMPQIVALSAVIGNINDFDAWLDCEKLVTFNRPVPLIEGVMDRTGRSQCVNGQGDVEIQQLLPADAIRMRKNKPEKQDMIVPLVRKLVADGEKVIIFRNRRGSAQGCANYLAEELGLPPTTDVMSALPLHDLSSTSVALKKCLQGGTAFHTANLAREERTLVEQAFRHPGGGIHVLGATTTVAAGINTPASTVILAEQEFIGDDGRSFTVAEYKNMAGRAGRLGFNEKGKAIILADTPQEREILFRRYVQGSLESLHSSFDPRNLETWLIRLLAQVKVVPRAEVSTLLLNTFGGYLATRNIPDWQRGMQGEIEKVLARMLELGLAEQEGPDIQLTLLGSVCGQSALSFQSAMRLVELIRSAESPDLTAVQIMALIQALDESDGGYTPMFRKGTRESASVQEAARRYGTGIVRLLQRYTQGDQFRYYARCKRAAILWDWIHGVPTDVIEQRYTITPFSGNIGYGDIRRFTDATRYHLRAAHQIAMILLLGTTADENAIETLFRQLEVGIPSDAVGLLDLPFTLSRGEALALYAMGAKNASDFWVLPEESRERILGKQRTVALERYHPATQAELDVAQSG